MQVGANVVYFFHVHNCKSKAILQHLLHSIRFIANFLTNVHEQMFHCVYFHALQAINFIISHGLSPMVRIQFTLLHQLKRHVQNALFASAGQTIPFKYRLLLQVLQKYFEFVLKFHFTHSASQVS
jgi:hypothetical protein